MNSPEIEPSTDSRQFPRGFSEQLRGLGDRLKMADLIFDHIENGALVTDAAGYILYFNRPYAELRHGLPSRRRWNTRRPIVKGRLRFWP